MSRFIFALGIRFVGEQVSKLLVEFLQERSTEESPTPLTVLELLKEVTQEELESIDGFGDRIAQGILEWIADD